MRRCTDAAIVGWSLLGSNGHARADRLAQLGWTPGWTKKEPLAIVIADMLDVGVNVERT